MTIINLKQIIDISNKLRNNVFAVSSIIQKYSTYDYNYYSSSFEIQKYSVTLNKCIFKSSNVLKTFLLSRNIFSSQIYYADKKKKNTKSSGKKLDLREISEIYDVEKLNTKFENSIIKMKEDFINQLSIRSSSGSIELLKVEMDGKDYELQELAQIIRNPKVVILKVNFVTAIPNIIKAINKSGLNINPQQDGTTISLPIPKVTKEHREKLSKNAKAIYIKYRDQIKNNRSEAIKEIKYKKTISPDVIYRSTSLLEKIADPYLDQIEDIFKSKQKELLG